MTLVADTGGLYALYDADDAHHAVIVTAERLNIRRILTVDEQDFRAVRPKKGYFVLLPADA